MESITKSDMNDLLLSGALDYLESCPGVAVEANSNPPVAPAMIGSWESANKRKLPQDLKDFLSVSNGLIISWYGSLAFDKLKKSTQKDMIKMGCISINSLKDMILGDVGDCEAFEIQDIDPFGKVYVVYGDNDTSIQLYLNGEWTLLALDFSSYFRLQIEYLGIRGWQMSRTRDGMPQDSSDWLNFYLPMSKSENVSRIQKKEISMDKIQKLISIMASREELNK